MREYGRVFSRIWESTDFRSLTEDGRMLVMYLLTCKHATIAGVFRVPDGYACEDLQWDSSRVAEGFSQLFQNSFATRCETTKWVWVKKFLQWNPPENPNQRKSASRIAMSIPNECSWKRDFMRVCGPSLGIGSSPDEKGSETVTEPFRNQEQDKDKEINPPNPPAGGDKPKRERKPRVALKTFIERCMEAGEKPISEYRPLLEYVEATGLPVDFVQLCWHEFKSEFLPGGSKSARLQADWRSHFLNFVRKGYYRLWYAKPDGTFELTTAGVQAKALHSQREAA